MMRVVAIDLAVQKMCWKLYVKGGGTRGGKPRRLESLGPVGDGESLKVPHKG